MNNPYESIVARKRKWTPVQTSKGEFKPGSEETIMRALALRNLEIPVKEFLTEGLEKELPNKPGVREALLSNMADEDNHDLGFSYIVNAHGVDEKAEAEAMESSRRQQRCWKASTLGALYKE